MQLREGVKKPSYCDCSLKSWESVLKSNKYIIMEARIIEIELHKWFDDESLSEKAQKLIFRKGEYFYAKLPAKVDWCNSCNGTGKRSKYDVEGYDINEMMYEDGVIDHEFAERYFNGHTDIQCNECKGTKIQNITDWESCNDVQLEILERNQKAYQEEAYDRAYSDMERRMGA